MATASPSFNPSALSDRQCTPAASRPGEGTASGKVIPVGCADDNFAKTGFQLGENSERGNPGSDNSKAGTLNKDNATGNGGGISGDERRI